MRIFSLLLILLAIEGQNLTAFAEGDSLRIARPVFDCRQENSASQLFVARLQCYAHPAVCMMALCHGSCGARADSCQIPSRAVLSAGHPGRLQVNQGCAGADDCSAQSEAGTPAQGDLCEASNVDASGCSKIDSVKRAVSSGSGNAQTFNHMHALKAPNCCSP